MLGSQLSTTVSVGLCQDWEVLKKLCLGRVTSIREADLLRSRHRDGCSDQTGLSNCTWDLISN